MSCCPNTGCNTGHPFDPDDEAPSEADMARFGDDSEYSEFDDQDALGVRGPVWGGGASASAAGPRRWKKAMAPAVAVVVLLAFVFVFVV